MPEATASTLMSLSYSAVESVDMMPGRFRMERPATVRQASGESRMSTMFSKVPSTRVPPVSRSPCW